jgi:ABC-type Na+ efflux pump permease subunit
MDWLGMYWVLFVLLFHESIGEGLAFGPMVVMAGIAAFAFSFMVQARFDALMGVAAVGISAVNALIGNSLLAALGIMTFIVAYAFWNADKSEIGLWGHANWHILSAVALLCAFLSRHP